jgi:hypothetical protein
MRVLAVGMRDPAIAESFWVEVEPDRVEAYEVDSRGAVRRLPLPPQSVEAMEIDLAKRGAGRLLADPQAIETLAELNALLGAFELGRAGRCVRKRGTR